MIIQNKFQQEGFDSYFKGISNDRSPYEINDDKGLEWDIGWKIAMNYFKFYIPTANFLPV